MKRKSDFLCLFRYFSWIWVACLIFTSAKSIAGGEFSRPMEASEPAQKLSFPKRILPFSLIRKAERLDAHYRSSHPELQQMILDLRVIHDESVKIRDSVQKALGRVQRGIWASTSILEAFEDDYERQFDQELFDLRVRWVHLHHRLWEMKPPGASHLEPLRLIFIGLKNFMDSFQFPEVSLLSVLIRWEPESGKGMKPQEVPVQTGLDRLKFQYALQIISGETRQTRLLKKLLPILEELVMFCEAQNRLSSNTR